MKHTVYSWTMAFLIVANCLLMAIVLNSLLRTEKERINFDHPVPYWVPFMAETPKGECVGATVVRLWKAPATEELMAELQQQTFQQMESQLGSNLQLVVAGIPVRLAGP